MMKKRSAQSNFANAFLRLLLLFCALLAPHADLLAASFCASDILPSNGIINTYFPATANAAAGSSAIALGAADVSMGGSSAPIAAGDTVLIVQMQDASINYQNSSAYGSGGNTGSGYTAIGQTGLYEYATAANSVPAAGGNLSLTAPLTNSYKNSAATSTQGEKSFQVIRVPVYDGFTPSANVKAAAWNGSAGGVLALDDTGTLNWNNKIFSAAGMGFRGGSVTNATSGLVNNPEPAYVTTGVYNGTKGEGIAGTPRYLYNSYTQTASTNPTGYPGGTSANADHARGAPGNAGGGGTDGNPSSNDENTGGGGGSNASPGGTGGFGWTSGNNAQWFTNLNQPGNFAYPKGGGLGGATVSQLSGSRVTMGGGGGAGTANNNSTCSLSVSAACSSGGNGGGLVFIRSKGFTGTGIVDVSGHDAPSFANNDPGGGGGAGGSIVINTTASSIGNVTLRANGGNGGSVETTDMHGPGGGGGAGFIALSSTITNYTGISFQYSSGQSGIWCNSGLKINGAAPAVSPTFNGTPTCSGAYQSKYGATDAVAVGTLGTVDKLTSAFPSPGAPQAASCQSVGIETSHFWGGAGQGAPASCNVGHIIKLRAYDPATGATLTNFAGSVTVSTGSQTALWGLCSAALCGAGQTASGSLSSTAAVSSVTYTFASADAGDAYLTFDPSTNSNYTLAPSTADAVEFTPASLTFYANTSSFSASGTSRPISLTINPPNPVAGQNATVTLQSCVAGTIGALQSLNNTTGAVSAWLTPDPSNDPSGRQNPTAGTSSTAVSSTAPNGNDVTIAGFSNVSGYPTATFNINTQDVGKWYLNVQFKLKIGTSTYTFFGQTPQITSVPFALLVSNPVNASGSANPGSALSNGAIFASAESPFSATVTAYKYPSAANAASADADGDGFPNSSAGTSIPSAALASGGALATVTSGKTSNITGTFVASSQTPSSGVLGTLSNPGLGSFSSGISQNAALSYNEAGSFSLSLDIPSAYLGTSRPDMPYRVCFAPAPPSANAVCGSYSLSSKASQRVGRFGADHFAIALTGPNAPKLSPKPLYSAAQNRSASVSFSAGNPLITFLNPSDSSFFSAGDPVSVASAGSLGSPLHTTIQSVSPGSALLAVSPSTSSAKSSMANNSSYAYMGEPIKLEWSFYALGKNNRQLSNYDTALGFAQINGSAPAGAPCATGSCLGIWAYADRSSAAPGSKTIYSYTRGTSFCTSSGNCASIKPFPESSAGPRFASLSSGYASGVVNPSFSCVSGMCSFSGFFTLNQEPSISSSSYGGPDGPFQWSSAPVLFGAIPTDSDGATLAPSDMNLDADSASGNDRGLLGSANFLAGRLRISNALATANLPLRVPLAAQIWNGEGWTTNAMDNYTFIPGSSIYVGNPVPAANMPIPGLLAAPQPMRAGLSFFTLSNIPASNWGKVSVGINLETSKYPVFAPCSGLSASPAMASSGAGLPWLRSNWCTGSGGPTDPLAAGNYAKKNANEKLIYTREVY